jgi:lipoyl(octanoyl) transferase
MMQRVFLPHAEIVPFACQSLQTVLDQQLAYVEHVRHHPDKAFILVGEHNPVYTVGRAFKQDYPNAINGIPVVAVARGGQLTYHGPGQLVIYPVVAIRAVGGVPALLQQLEHWIGDALKQLGLTIMTPPKCQDKPVTGVWLKTNQGLRKVASIGLALKHWVSYHGVALNVCNPLVPFHAITPCGFSSSVMTSVYQQWLNTQPGVLPPNWSHILQTLKLT